MELDQAKEKLEELQLDYQLLKEEMAEKRGDRDENMPTSYEMKQLEQQNARLRDTLVRMRDFAAHEKHEMLKLTRDLEAKKNENSDLMKEKNKLIARTAELENQVTDLHEQVCMFISISLSSSMKNSKERRFVDICVLAVHLYIIIVVITGISVHCIIL